MTEKKSLNFDFLDEGLEKKTDEAVSASVSASVPTTIVQKVSFSEYIKEYYSNFTEFSKKYLVAKSPKYLWVAVWLVGVGGATKDLTSSDSTSWVEVWAIAALGGILAGLIAYYITGWFYHIRVLWSKGQGDISTARNISIFSSLPIALVSIGSLILNQMVYGSNYFSIYATDASTVDVLFAFLSIAAIIYSIILSYRAVRGVMQAKKGRAIGWFIVAPAIFYIVLLFSEVLN